MAVMEWRRDEYKVTFPNGVTMCFPAYALRIILPKASRVGHQQADAGDRKRVRVLAAQINRACLRAHREQGRM